MKSLHKFISFLLLGGSGVSLAQEGPWAAFINKGMLDATESAFELSSTGSTDLTIEANGGRFWIGKAASAYCPSDVDKLDCSAFKGNQTIFVGGNDFGDGAIALKVVVPGGQQGTYLPSSEEMTVAAKLLTSPSS